MGRKPREAGGLEDHDPSLAPGGGAREGRLGGSFLDLQSKKDMAKPLRHP